MPQAGRSAGGPSPGAAHDLRIIEIGECRCKAGQVGRGDVTGLGMSLAGESSSEVVGTESPSRWAFRSMAATTSSGRRGSGCQSLRMVPSARGGQLDCDLEVKRRGHPLERRERGADTAGLEACHGGLALCPFARRARAG